MIVADIKCQTSFVFSGIKDRFHFPARGRLQHLQFCCRYCLTFNFPATSPLLTLSGEIKCVSAKEIWLVLIKSKSEHRNQDGRSSELFLGCWRVDVQGQKDSSKRDSLPRLSWSCSIITCDGHPSQRPNANLSSSACSEQQQLHCELSGFWALRIIWAGSEGEGWGNIFTGKVRASPSSSALVLQRTARFLKLEQGVWGQLDLQALFLIPAHPPTKEKNTFKPVSPPARNCKHFERTFLIFENVVFLLPVMLIPDSSSLCRQTAASRSSSKALMFVTHTFSTDYTIFCLFLRFSCSFVCWG